MAAIKARLPPVPPRRSACGSRSSSVSPAAMALPSCPSAGWSSALSPGLAVTAAWPRTSRQPSPRPQPWFTSPRSSSSCGVSQNLDQQRSVLEWALTGKHMPIQLVYVPAMVGEALQIDLTQLRLSMETKELVVARNHAVAALLELLDQ